MSNNACKWSRKLEIDTYLHCFRVNQINIVSTCRYWSFVVDKACMSIQLCKIIIRVFNLLKYLFKGIKIVYDQKFVESQIDIIIHGISRVCQLARRVKVNIVLYYLYSIVVWPHSTYCTTVRTILSHLHVLYKYTYCTLYTQYMFPVSLFPMLRFHLQHLFTTLVHTYISIHIQVFT